MKDAVLSAIAEFENFFSLLENKEGDVGRSFRARCRELSSLIEDVGLTSALSFCYAKATDSVYKEMRELIESKSRKIDEKDSLNRGYAIYLYLVLKRLKILKLIESDLNNPRNALKELAEGKEIIASKLLRPYIVQLKKLSEAVFKEKK